MEQESPVQRIWWKGKINMAERSGKKRRPNPDIDRPVSIIDLGDYPEVVDKIVSEFRDRLSDLYVCTNQHYNPAMHGAYAVVNHAQYMVTEIARQIACRHIDLNLMSGTFLPGKEVTDDDDTE
jgi:hypothetical protein